MEIKTTVGNVIEVLERFAPKAYQESFDNSGLQVGNPNSEVTGILVCIDVTEAVVDEAIDQGCNFIVSHHPLIFKALKSIVGRNYIERCVIKALANGIAIYAGHTNVDSAPQGVSYRMAQKLGLKNIRVLVPHQGALLKLITFVPKKYLEAVRSSLFAAGCGHIGNYDHCSYRVSGEGSFRAQPGATPFVGELGQEHYEAEERLEVIVPKYLCSNAVAALKSAHPYEEPAFDLIALENDLTTVGLGVVGELAEPTDGMQFLRHIKELFNTQVLKYSPLTQNTVQRIALCGGSGADFIGAAQASGAQIYISGEIGYHRFFEHENRISLVEIGHYESEQFTKEIFCEQLMENFCNFAVRISRV